MSGSRANTPLPAENRQWNGDTTESASAAPSSSSTRVSGHSQDNEKQHPDYLGNSNPDGLVLDQPREKEQDAEQQQAGTQPPKNTTTDPSSFPDGGLEAWTVVLGGFCALFVSFGWINCVGIFQAHYSSDQLKEYSASTVAWIPSLEICMMFIVAPICGKVFDNYGTRHLLAVGTFLHVFGLMMTSLATEYYQFILAQGICSPLGAGALFYPTMNSVTTWFFHKRALALGIVASGSSLGGIIMPIMVQKLIPRLGFPWAMRICAFMILGLCIIANLAVKPRLSPQKKPFHVMEFLTPFKEIPYALTAMGAFLFFFGLFLPFTFLVVHAKRYGMSAELAGYLVSILNAASIFGRIVPGWVADRIGRYNLVTVVSLISGILVLALWMPARGNGAIIPFAALYGFVSGSLVSVIPALVAQISDVRQIGVRTGALFATVSVAGLTGNPIGGALVPNGLDFWRMQVFAGVMMIAGGMFFGFARVSVTGMKLLKKF